MIKGFSKAFQQKAEAVLAHAALCSRCLCGAELFQIPITMGVAKFRFLPPLALSAALLPRLANISSSPKLGQQSSLQMWGGLLVWGRAESNGVSPWLQVLGATFFIVACLLYKPPPPESPPGSLDASENGTSDLQEHKPSLPAEEDI